MKRLLIGTMIALSFSVVASEPTQDQISAYNTKRATMTHGEIQDREFDITKKYFELCSPILNYKRLDHERYLIDVLVEGERTRILRTTTDYEAARQEATNLFNYEYKLIDELKASMLVKLSTCYQEKIVKEF